MTLGWAGPQCLSENLIFGVIPSEARNLALNVFKGRARFLVACGSLGMTCGRRFSHRL
jgi:hypothetical protein